MPDNDHDHEFFQALIDEGVDESIVNRFKDFNNGSPLRRAARQATKNAAQVAEENQTLRKIVMESTFTKAGIKINPSALQLPSDLDITSTDAVSKWAVEMGLKDNTPSAPPEDFAAFEEMEEVTGSSDPPDSGRITPLMASEWPMDKSLKFAAAHPEAWEQLKRGNEVRGVVAT